MGNCKSRCSATALPWAPARETTLLLLGLDNAGKSTLLANLNGESTDNVTPTIGFASSNLDIGRYEVTLYDLGGGPRIRGIWKNYFSEAHGIIFVVDSSTPQRVDEAKEVLNNVLQHEKVGGKPLLVFANKQDQDGAVDETELSDRLDLDTLMGDNRPNSNLVKCVAHKSASGNRSDPSIKQGVRWLLQTIGSQYDNLNERVRADVIEQKAFEAQQRKERSERVRRIREERERQQALSGEPQEGSSDYPDQGVISNPFRPIAEVAQEAEEREKAAKAAKRAKKVQTQVSVEVELQVSSVTESTSNEPSDVLDDRRENGVCLPESGGAKVQKSTSQSTIASQTTSGLSESSDSLTDVTPRSHGSSDSLHLSVPSQDIAHTTASVERGEIGEATTQPENVQTEGIDKGKKRSRKMLLSRLKNRNKTAPALIPIESPHSSSNNQVKPEHSILSKRDTWTGPELEAVVITPPHTPTFPPTATPLADHGQQQPPVLPVADPLAGLPELPRNRHTLPPLKVLKTPAGMGDNTFHLSEDVAALPPSKVIPLSQPPTAASSLEPVVS